MKHKRDAVRQCDRDAGGRLAGRDLRLRGGGSEAVLHRREIDFRRFRLRSADHRRANDEFARGIGHRRAAGVESNGRAAHDHRAANRFLLFIDDDSAHARDRHGRECGSGAIARVDRDGTAMIENVIRMNAHDHVARLRHGVERERAFRVAHRRRDRRTVAARIDEDHHALLLHSFLGR